jgi:hypothetical protein
VTIVGPAGIATGVRAVTAAVTVAVGRAAMAVAVGIATGVRAVKAGMIVPATTARVAKAVTTTGATVAIAVRAGSVRAAMTTAPRPNSRRRF